MGKNKRNQHYKKMSITPLMSTLTLEAESVAHIVLKAYNLDSEDYSIPYISSWSSGKDTKELKACMESIRSTADEMITGINRSLDRQKKREQREQDMER